MATRRKTYKLRGGDVYDVEEYPDGRYGAKGKARQKKKKPTPEQMAAVNRTTTFFRLKDGGVGVRCGCFYGTLAQFRDKIRETHGETKKAQEYLMLADLMELRFEEDENEVGNRKYVE